MDTLTRMRAFVAVVDANGYAAAGRKIGRSKALLSRYVRELEDELGALLLNRTTRRLSLTAAGETYYRRAAEIIRDVDGLGDLVRDQSSSAGGSIRLTAPRAFAEIGGRDPFIEFAVRHPSISLEIDLSDRFIDLVEEGFDLAIRATALEDSGLIAKRLRPVRSLVLASPGLLESEGEPQHPQDLAGRALIIDSNRRNHSQLRFRDGNGEPLSVSIGKGRLMVGSPRMALRAAVAGLGLAVVPDFVAQDAVSAGQVREVLAPFRSDDTAIYALYPHRRHQPQRVRLLLDFLGEWFREGRDQEHQQQTLRDGRFGTI